MPRITAPAARNRFTMKASRGAMRSFQRQRSGRGLHAIVRVDVILDQKRDAVQRPARLARPAFLVARCGDGQRVGVEFDHGVDRWPVLVDLFDALQIACDLSSGQFARTHFALQFKDGEFFHALLHRLIRNRQRLIDDLKRLFQLWFGDDQWRIGEEQIAWREVIQAVLFEIGADLCHL